MHAVKAGGVGGKKIAQVAVRGGGGMGFEGLPGLGLGRIDAGQHVRHGM